MNPVLLDGIILGVKEVVPWLIQKIHKPKLQRLTQRVWKLVDEAEQRLISDPGGGAAKKHWVQSSLFERYPKLLAKVEREMGEAEAKTLVSKLINQAADRLEMEERGGQEANQLASIAPFIVDILMEGGHHALARSFETSVRSEWAAGVAWEDDNDLDDDDPTEEG